MHAEWSASSTFARKATRPFRMTAESGTLAYGQTHPAGMAGNVSIP